MRLATIVVLALLTACATPGHDAADTGASDTAGPIAAGDSSARNSPEPSTKIELRTDSSRYSSGAAVTLTLVNTTDGTYAFNPCTRIVQREANGGWTPVDEPQRICTMEAWLLEPRATRSGNTELPSALEPGRYRVAVSLTLEGQTPPVEHELAVSEPFTVSR